MSSTGKDAEGSWGDSLFARSEEHEYFRQIEEAFLELRGSPLTLSPKDWRVSKEWFERGIPVELVCETAREVLKRKEKEQKGKDNFLSLRFVKSAVERAFEARQKLLAAGVTVGDEGDSLSLADQLSAVAELVPEEFPFTNDLQKRILALDGGGAAVEEALAELDAEMLKLAWQALDGPGRERVEERLRTARETLGRRLTQDEVDAAAERLREQILREEAGLPVLSLFSV